MALASIQEAISRENYPASGTADAGPSRQPVGVPTQEPQDTYIHPVDSSEAEQESDLDLEPEFDIDAGETSERM